MKRLSERSLSLVLALGLCAIIGGGCTKASKAKRLLAAGKREYLAQHYDAAEIDYESVLHFVPRHPSAVAHLGLIYFQEGRLPRAYAYLKIAHQLAPENFEVTLRLAQVSVEANHFTEAAPLAALAMSQNPESEEAPMTVVDASRTAAQLAAAAEQIQQAQLACPTNAGLAAALGLIDLRQNKTTAAEPEFQKALQLDSKLAAGHLGLAGICASHKDFKHMEEELQLAAEVSPVRSAARLKYAEFKFQIGSIGAAEEALEEMARQAPDYLPALKELMRIQYSQRQYSDCKATIAKILARDPADYDALLQSGSIYLAQRDGAGALQVFQRMDALNHSIVTVKYSLAGAYLLQNDKAHALIALHEAVGLDPDYSPAVLLLADLDVRGGQAPEAVAVLNTLLKKQTNNPQAHLELANAYLAQNRPEPALALYEQMMQKFPKDPKIPFLIAGIYEQQGNISQAYTFFERSLALSPDNSSALEKLTELDLSQKNYTNAQQRIATQIQRYPKASDPRLFKARLYWAEGQTNEAVRALSKAIELDPTSPLPYLSLAKIYLDSHQEKQALDRLMSLTSKTNDVTAWIEIGMIQQMAKEYPAARDAYEKALSFDPKSSAALNDLAYLYSEFLGDLPKAHEMAEKMRQLQPYEPRGADTLGWIFYKEGKYPRALSLLKESSEQLPEDPEILTHLGMTYYMMEEGDPARVCLQRATADPEDYPGKKEALECLQLLAIDPNSLDENAEKAVQRRLAESPNDPVALDRLAAIDERHNQPDKAAAIYEKILGLNSQDWKAMVGLAGLYAGPLHDTRKALDLAKSAHDIAPNEAAAAALLGNLVYRSGDYGWALSLLQAAAAGLPNNASVLYDFAWASYTVGHLTEADTAMSNVVEHGESFPKIDDAKQFLGLRRAAKDAAEAQKWSGDVQKILEQKPDYLPATMVSALIDEQQGDDKGAGKIYQQALANFPLFTPAMRQLALITARHPETDSKAYEWAQKAESALPEDRPLERAVGILAYRHADYDRSAQLLRRSDNDGEALYYLGMDYYHLQQLADSKRALKRALTLNVPDTFATEARRVLAQLK